ncbi:hypothetical protein GCM10010521_17500 [Streptomyces rameus]|uniref:Uncharacterized protein n=1 Tax=Streptomyces rameus TaxID=68261 RepID=A0ABP6N022_9ACTN
MELLLARLSGGRRQAAGWARTLGSCGVIKRFGADAVPGSAASMWVSEMPDDPVGWLAGHGWGARKPHPARTPCRLRRPILTPPQGEERPGGLISALRRYRPSAGIDHPAGHTSAGHTSAGHTSAGHTSAGHTSAGHTSAGHTAGREHGRLRHATAVTTTRWGCDADTVDGHPGPTVSGPGLGLPHGD